jgi:hypothetical protein
MSNASSHLESSLGARASALPLADASAPQSGVEVPVEAGFIEKTLRPYAAKSCIYQKSAVHSFHSDSLSHGTRATFSIGDSCYIDSTGHFNAVELNICANQMYYVLWADIIRRKQIGEVAHWTERDFESRQLPGMLIVKIESEFRRPIDPRDFRGEGRIERMRVVGSGARRTLFMRTRASFTDNASGLARCTVDFAIF